MAVTFHRSMVFPLLRSMQSFAKRPDLCEALRAAGEPLTVEACEPARGPASAQPLRLSAHLGAVGLSATGETWDLALRCHTKASST